MKYLPPHFISVSKQSVLVNSRSIVMIYGQIMSVALFMSLGSPINAEYTNEIYDFTIENIRGALYCNDSAPNPNHGVTIFFSHLKNCPIDFTGQDRISVIAEYNSLEDLGAKALAARICGNKTVNISPLKIGHEVTFSCGTARAEHNKNYVAQRQVGFNKFEWINIIVTIENKEESISKYQIKSVIKSIHF